MVFFKGRHRRRWWRREVETDELDSSDQQIRLEEARRARETAERIERDITSRDGRAARLAASMRKIYEQNHLAGLFAYEVTTKKKDP